MMLRSAAAAVLLLTSVAASAAPKSDKADEHEKSADSQDKVICKRFAQTGSLIQSRRICKTKRDWERERDALRMTNSINSCANQGSTGGC